MSNQDLANIWNKHYPPGTEVMLTNDDYHIEHTHTRSEAWLLGSGHPVVKVDGKAGGYSLNRITPIHPIGTPG